ncbi:MAG: hypothetical protein M9928_14390 [Anaerolineae bacterium]|nr:hypothetical protein [Anaerolineae bacterium]
MVAEGNSAEKVTAAQSARLRSTWSYASAERQPSDTQLAGVTKPRQEILA